MNEWLLDISSTLNGDKEFIMGKVLLKNMVEGMELDENLYNFNGVLLMPSGTILEEKHLRALNVWGITAAKIKGSVNNQADKKKPDQVTPDMILEIEQKLKKKYSKTNMTHPVITEIFRIDKAMRLAGLMSEEDNL